MLKYIAIVVLVLSGTALSAPQQDNLDSLISSVFGNNGNQNNQNQPSTNNPLNTGAPVQQGDSIDKLIDETFNPKTKNDRPTILQPDVGAGLNLQNHNGPCECVPYYQCQNGSIVADGEGLIDIRLKPSGPCENYLDICCAPPDIIKDHINNITPPPFKPRGCGQRHQEGVGYRITDSSDNEAQFGEFPWMVAVLKEEAIGQNGAKMNVYQCGGSLIHPQVVLTAAHCVSQKQARELKIRAGEWDTQTKSEVLPHQDRDVANIIVHENFHAGALRNDFALLVLAHPVTLADNVDVACLPVPGAVFDGSRCYASGWGKDVFGKEGRYQVILKRVDLPIVSHDACERTLRKTRLGNFFVLDQSFICAGGEPGKDTCRGDGGSPLVCPLPEEPSRYVQVGTVAWGIGCGENNVPGVYGNVASARQWIDRRMNDIGFDISQYVYSY